MAVIWIPEHLKADVGTRCHWDVYPVDVRLRDGRVFRNLAAREGVCITGYHDGTADSALPFVAADIETLRPHIPLLPFWATELWRRCTRPAYAKA